MMSEPLTKQRFYAPRYWHVWLGFGLLRLIAFLPWSWMMAVGRGIGRLGMRVTPRRVRVTDINLRRCFPELNEGDRTDLVRRHFESMGMGIMDMAITWWARDPEAHSLVRIHGREHAEAVLRGESGVIFLTAHFTSVEMSARALLWIGNVLPVYRPQRNPAVEWFVTRNRESGNKQAVEKAIPREDVRQMLRALKAKKGLWFAPDQNFGDKYSLFSPFFGIPAATNTATSRLARMTGARVVPFVTFRREDAPGYDLYIEPPLEGFAEGDLQGDTDRINAIIERWVRRAPAQYLWSHRRFKDRPEGEAPFY
jgi:KDO2-lipid IV(A) lauroyltransferase